MANSHQLTMGGPGPVSATGSNFTSYTFVNTTDQVEFIFQVPDDAGAATVTITQLGYRLSSVTGTSPVMKISLQGVDASGNPDGVIKGGGSPASATFTPSGSNTWNWVTLANSFTANRGDFLAIVIAYNSGTLNGSNTPVITVVSGTTSVLTSFPYATQNVAGVRTRQANLPVYGFNNGTKGFGYPLQNVVQTLFSTTSERALRWVLDTGTVGTYKVAAIRLQVITPAANKTVKAILYSGTTALQTATWDSDANVSAGSARVVTLWFQDATLATLFAGQEYRIGLQPQDAATNIAWTEFQFAAQSDMDALAGGQNWYLSTRASGGATAWTDGLTSRPVAELIMSDVTVPPPGLIIAT